MMHHKALKHVRETKKTAELNRVFRPEQQSGEGCGIVQS